MNYFLHIVRQSIFLLLLLAGGCATRRGLKPPKNMPPPTEVRTMEVTGYCECGICCGWKRSWWRLGKPVIAYGPNKGKAKEVGMTASGTPARSGTIAADTSIFPMGTVMYVPGYGWGMVEDRGGAIKGMKLDLFFESHEEALNWGRQQLKVQVWKKKK